MTLKHLYTVAAGTATVGILGKSYAPPRNRERGLSRRHIRRDNFLVTDSPHRFVG